MVKYSLRKLVLVACAALLLSASGCRQAVILTPGDDDLVVLNGCVISACNYLAVVKAQNKLDQNFWANYDPNDPNDRLLLGLNSSFPYFLCPS